MFRILLPLLHLVLRCCLFSHLLSTSLLCVEIDRKCSGYDKEICSRYCAYADEILKANVYWTASSEFALFYHLILCLHISPLLVVSISRLLLGWTFNLCDQATEGCSYFCWFCDCVFYLISESHF